MLKFDQQRHDRLLFLRSKEVRDLRMSLGILGCKGIIIVSFTTFLSVFWNFKSLAPVNVVRIT